MRTMNIGRLNKRLTFKKLGAVTDSMGQTSQKLTEICTVWGSLYPVRGSERYEIQKIEGTTTHKCYIRYRSDIDSNCYIEYDGKQFDITAVINVDFDNKMLEIDCAEHINKAVKENE